MVDSFNLEKNYADEMVGAEFKDGIVVEAGREAFLRQFNAVAFDMGEEDLERIALRPDDLHLNRVAWWLRGCDNRLGSELEGNTKTSAYSTLKRPLSGPSSFKS